eukprot:CAMPEP_0169135262 /NCGR_PEP_ID=MMETSP1015-20121227/40353_1 /TAXON_ID=342587 /ORGANISM="Karlodinium micrum, Strain CCMP2283" /LENGTH=505 /DNA_ID=CAMNT_0009199911 /DNA_START=15 /DNA_END=1532 /DNA_ORIENTATION=+
MRTLTIVLTFSLAFATHYEDPKNGCGSDEQAIQVQGVSGDFCSPPCNGTVCPTDPPSASDAKPQCALHSPSGDKYCALVCKPGSNDACPEGASCQPIQGTGLCTYPGSGPAPTPSPGQAGKWTVLDGQFSAVTIGIAFRNDKFGWTTQTTGSSLPQVVTTQDSGASWSPVAQAPASPIPMSVTSKKGSGPSGVVALTGVGATEYSFDGEHFNRSLALVLASQDIKYQNGRMTLTQASGPCVSTTNGVFYTCHKVPYKYGQTGRYSSSPSANVIYHTAGTWPSKSGPTMDFFEITSNLRVARKLGEVKYEVGPKTISKNDPPSNQTYTAELWKSSDGGKTWKNIVADEGNYYFNDIHCIDDTHCVAVGEGFANDGSKSPGARVFMTIDGETFKEVHRETTDGASLMAAKMLSATEHWAGGSSKAGGLTAPVLALHSTDSGKTYTNEHGTIIGQMITAMDFVSPQHGYATTVNALQVSSLLQYGVAPSSATMQLSAPREVLGDAFVV